jgi:hypothetical protein
MVLNLKNIDATIVRFDPDFKVETIEPKALRPPKDWSIPCLLTGARAIWELAMSENESSRYGSDEQLLKYRMAMEAAGEEVVRLRLANRMAITDDGNTNPPPGLAIIWLREKSLKRARREGVKFWIILIVAVRAAISRTIHDDEVLPLDVSEVP